MLKLKYFILILSFFVLSTLNTFSQGKVIDQIVAIVGSNIIKLSDIENQYLQMRAQGNFVSGDSSKCSILENMLFSKLLLNQAKLDSLVLTDEQVESEMERRLRYYVAQFGSKEKFEEFYKKSIIEFKAEFKDIVKNQMLVQRMEEKITENVKVTPLDVKKYFNEIPKDSIPLIESEYEIGHIVRQPFVSKEEKAYTKQRLEELRERIVKGEKFSSLAVLYSEDPGSAKKGGELGLYGRGELYPEFEAAAYGLKKDEISPVIETKAGFHIIQLIERRGDYINARHILFTPKVSPYQLGKAKAYLDSIYTVIKDSAMQFSKAAMRYSDDLNKNNNGMIVNTATGNTKFSAEEVDPTIFFTIDKMKPGEISKPVLMKDSEGKQAYRILYLKNRTSPHKANLQSDYDKIQNAALERAKGEVVKKWTNEKIRKTYINIFEPYNKCKFDNNWLK